MPEELLKNVYRIPIPLPGNPLRELNAYLILGGNRNLLIDTGFRQPACREALFAALSELGLGPGDVEVLLTHLHSDHSGLGPDAAGAHPIHISALDMPSLSDPAYQSRHWDRITARFGEEGFPPSLLEHMWETNPARSMAPPQGGHYVPLTDHQILEVGDYRLECLLMPGHTPGQMCFWMEAQGAMFLGDHVLFDITPNITAWPQMKDALGSYLDSLRKIRSYNVRLPLPGHRGGGDLKSRVDELLEHHRLRLEETLAVAASHPGRPAYDLSGYLTWKIRASSWDNFPPPQKWFAVGECISHLDHLVLCGAVRRELLDGKAAYFAI